MVAQDGNEADGQDFWATPETFADAFRAALVAIKNRHLSK